MSLPSQEILDGIKDLISEITGFKEDDDNFAICERYCLSHVVHHTYPFISKSTVKSLVNSYVSRFYGHGYFRVSQELDNQVKSFLSHEELFEKNPQYDIQWCLLSLVSSLSSNLTSVKKLPELLPINDEEKETEYFDWKGYLTNDLPQQDLFLLWDSEYQSRDEDEEEEEEEDDDNEDRECEEDVKEGKSKIEPKEKLCQDKKCLQLIFDNKIMFSCDNSSKIRQQRIEEFLKSRRSKRDLEIDIKLRGNITEKFNELLSREGITKRTQIVSEFELMENILFQLQTGERIFLRKGLVSPALTSLTEDTLGEYLESLQPYFRIIRIFREFDCEITEARYPEKCLNESYFELRGNQLSNVMASCSNKRIIPSILYVYNVMLRKSVEPFQKEVTDIVENLGSYTLIQMEQKLRPYYSDLTSLFYVHKLATKNWNKDCNWMSSIRILSVLYNSIMDAISTRMSFLYLNVFLRCFQVYLDIIDSWISFLDLIDPNDEFIVAKSDSQGKSDNKCSEYETRTYKAEMENFGVKNVFILDLISEKMVQVGQSLEVLRRLNRFVATGTAASEETFFHLLLKSINEKVDALGKVNSVPKPLKPPGKPKSIFTMKNIGLGLEIDRGEGDSSQMGSILTSMLKEDEKKNKDKTLPEKAKEKTKIRDYSGEFINSMVTNPFFKMTFGSIGIKQVHNQLEKAKDRLKLDSGDEALMAVKKPEKGKSGIYPLNKIVTEAFHNVLESRISGTCALVKDIVLRECNLPAHLSLLRSILLFNDSYLIQPFFFALFTQPIIWRSSYSLSFHLKECVRSFYKENANGLSVIVTKNDSSKCENILQVIDTICVEYEVKWPLTLIITPEAMRKYNEIFRLALKLKWAHWALCSLHFECSEGSSKSSKTTRHRFQLLRFWLLSALGRINNYFLTQMTPPELDLNSCNDLKEIIHEHSQFLEKIYQNCLLGEKRSEARKLILDTLITLCMNVFLEGIDINNEKLSTVEKTFASCHLSLSHLLYSLEKH